MSLYSQFETDSSLETKGINLAYGEDTFITIARAGGANKKFTKLMEKESRPYRRAIQSGTIEDKVFRKLMIKVFSETVVLGWKGVSDREGNELPFTPENCVKVFTDLPDLFTDVMAQAGNASLFLADIREAEAKNS